MPNPVRLNPDVPPHPAGPDDIPVTVHRPRPRRKRRAPRDPGRVWAFALMVGMIVMFYALGAR